MEYLNINELKQYINILDKSFIITKADLEGIITYANGNFCEISKYSKEELIGKPHNIIRHPLVPKKVFKDLWETITKGEIWENKLKNRAKDGSTYYVNTIIAPIKDEKGNNLYYISFRQDITELMKLKNKISLERTLLTNILNNTNNLICIRKNFKPFKATKKFLSTFGVKNIKEFTKKYKYLHHLFEKKECYFYTNDKNWDIKYKNNSLKVFIKDKIYLLYTDNFKLKKDIYSIINLTDITEIEEAKQKAQELDKLKTLFLAKVSHEMRTPLNAIYGYIELLKDSPLNEKQKEYIKNMENASKILLDIINDILDFSKIESNKLELDFVEINLYDLIISTFNTLKPIAKEKELEYILEIKTPIEECIVTDPIRLKQVLINLLNNAIKFTPQGFVKLIVEKDFTFRVIDSGIGIEKEKLSQIFESYIQANKSITRKYGGTGLGLNIAYKLIEKMGGELKVKSEVNKGSEFYFKLNPKTCNKFKLKDKIPSITLLNNKYEKEFKEFFEKLEVKIDKNSPIILTTDKNLKKENVILIFEEDKNYLYTAYNKLYHLNDIEKNKQNIKLNGYILLAEDYEFNRKFLKETLENIGLKVDTAKNGKEAIKKALKNDYDLILMDVTMPKIDGISAAIEIKKEKNLPIISVSAHTFKEDIEKFLKHTDDYLSKPIKKEKLINILQKYLKKENLTIKIKDHLNISEEESKEFINLFIESLEKSIKKLKKAIKEKDFNEMYKIFHNLKSSSGTLGIKKVYNISKELMEESIKKEDANYKDALKIFKEVLEKLKKES